VCLIVMAALALCPIVTVTVLLAKSTGLAPDVLAAGHARAATGLPAHFAAVRPVTDGQTRFELQTYLPTITAIWAFGVIALSLRLLGGLWVVERLKRKWSKPAPAEWQARLDELAQRLNMRGGVRLLVSDRVTVPSAMGVFRALVVVPTSFLLMFPIEQVECLLLHELAHVRRYDYLVNLLQTCVEVTLFYHPVVWWVSHLIRAEREHCCDDIVINATGNTKLYARALTRLEQQLNQVPSLSLSARGGQLMNRVARMLAIKPQPKRPAAVWPSILILIALSAGLTATVGAQAKPAGHKVVKKKIVHTKAKKLVSHKLVNGSHSSKTITSTARVSARNLTIVGHGVTAKLSSLQGTTIISPTTGEVKVFKSEQEVAEFLNPTASSLSIAGKGTRVGSVSRGLTMVNPTSRSFGIPPSPASAGAMAVNSATVSLGVPSVKATPSGAATSVSVGVPTEKPAEEFNDVDITLELDDVPFSQAIKALAKASGISYTLDPDQIIGKVTVTVHHKTLEDTLKAICYSAKASYRVESGTYYFSARELGRASGS
jgi:beta-lactamase regulating signal transducer with metallopeptidase domain